MHLKPIHIEKEMLRRLRQGDEKAFSWIYRTYKTPIAYRLLRLLKSETLVEEVLQNIFMNVWEHRTTIDADKSFRGYLYRMAQHKVIDLFRRAKKEKSILDEIVAANSELYTHIEEAVFRKENTYLLNQLISRLPARRREIFVACKLEGKSYQEVAEANGISTTTVNDHIQKAMQFLRNSLQFAPDAWLIVVINLLIGEL